MKQYKWKRSTGRKGCSPDNSACEGFFGRLKNEMFHNHDHRDTTVGEFEKTLASYIEWYTPPASNAPWAPESQTRTAVHSA